MNAIEKIQAVINTMESVTVAGADNWNRMLGCWQTLQDAKKEMIEHESDKTAVFQRNSENTAGAV